MRTNIAWRSARQALGSWRQTASSPMRRFKVCGLPKMNFSRLSATKKTTTQRWPISTTCDGRETQRVLWCPKRHKNASLRPRLINQAPPVSQSVSLSSPRCSCGLTY